MNIRKYAPWNWFKQEEQEDVPVRNRQTQLATSDPVRHLHSEIDRLFNEAFRGFPERSLFGDWSSNRVWPELSSVALKPNLDIKDSEENYIISVEIPGVAREDVDLEINGNTLTIRGEKRQEKKEERENYHCVERSYGSFERVLTLPRDANPDSIDANFKDGVLTINVKRQAVESSQEEGRKIEVKAAA